MNTSVQISSPEKVDSEALFSSTALFTQVGAGLVVVLLIFIIGARLFNKFSFFNRAKIQHHNLISIKANLTLGPQGRLMVVEFNQQWLLLGVSNEKINCLGKMNKPDDERVDDTFFKQVLKKVADQKDGGNVL